MLVVPAAVDTLVNAARVHGDITKQDLRYAIRSLRRTPGFTHHRDCGRRPGHWRHHRDVFGRRSRAVAAAAVPRRRPRRPALGGSLLARVSAHGTIAAELPRLAAHGHGVRAARALHRWLGQPGGPRRAGTGQRRVRRRRSISDPQATGGARASAHGIRCQRRRGRTADRDQRSNLADALCVPVPTSWVRPSRSTIARM